MSYPIAELITQNVVETVAGVQLPAGFNGNLTVERFRKGGRNTVDDLVAVVSFLDDDENPDSPIDFKSWIRPYWILVYVFEPESSSMPYDQRIDVVRADVERALMADVTRGGYAQNTEVRPPTRFDPENDASGILINFDVHYRHVEGDPYTQE